ncbi:MAG: HAMP domain-containing histidine kinase [Prevotellaceae bacterium]|jgi:anti-sigma regulatory factor (Ser/Thr protein kinase)|nr:HAMP domain-containing histidine kinase [Prevotellaceae bacterium]
MFLFAAALIVAASLYFTNRLTNKLADEERKKMELWTEAMQRFNSIDFSDTINFELIWKIIESNTQIPVIIADEFDNVINTVNINNITNDTARFFEKKISSFKNQNLPIELKISDDEKQYIYYDNSLLLKQLSYFPYIQLSIIAIFLAICFWAFAADKKSEQNRVWVGLSKETAHQLGTPISSLLAWEEILKTQNIDTELLNEMSKDIGRLSMIAERFSKVGSQPVLTEENIVTVLENAIAYMKNRTSQKVDYQIITTVGAGRALPRQPPHVKINVPLFEWVIENLCKNAVDAMEGSGKLTFEVSQSGKNVIIDVTDTGKGIERKNFKNVFRPGFTTKKRGWGLGLSLARRIIEDYHRGKIMIKSSEQGRGTTFRIILS